MRLLSAADPWAAAAGVGVVGAGFFHHDAALWEVHTHSAAGHGSEVEGVVPLHALHADTAG